MRKIFIFTLLFIFLFITVASSEELWRYELENALSFALKEENLYRISDLAKELKRDTIQGSVWNILEWEEKNIQYDFHKATLHEPVIRIWNTGKIEIIQGHDNIFQLPYETVLKRSGICKDYALLTAGLILAMDYTPVFVLDIGFLNESIRHNAVGVIINDWFFILDQHTPIMDAGTYYRHWLKEDKVINEIILYKIERREGIITKYRFDLNSFKNADYRHTPKDLEVISNNLMKNIVDNFPNLKINKDIEYLDRENRLPKGYQKGKTYNYKFTDFLEYYNPIFHYQFMERLYKDILKDDKIYADLKSFNYFFIRSESTDGTLKIILNLAS